MPVGNGNYTWKILKDPLEPGGFCPGTRFSDLDLAYMLINHAFEIGTVLHHRQFGKFTVIENNLRSRAHKMQSTKYLIKVTSGPRLTLAERVSS